ncbi:response regulator transcription factor [Pseudonocardia sp. DSM 110487]|uniref:response regulator transcription factor n=1 Tax=Pseudonocardia sp. DSM 110487 TaxID=2865833 RepID=UPI001C6A624E|nr:response regulator transcription factor [Pseudonocardia sp. DSM 110487]QYN34375.1 response regulator transcription factor [Pseudonocardia sp. DSM 110487]
MRVLVVEDDDGVAGAVVEALGTHGHRVERVARAADVWPHLRDADLVLLDLGLPDADGMDVLRRLRRIAATPVLVLTARDAERDVVRGLRLGADDYLVKPVRLRELLARVDAVVRRTRPAEGPTGDVVEIEDLQVHLAARRATVGGADVALTAKEFDILAALARRPGAAVSRQQLLDEVWGDAYLAVSRSLDVHLASLRSKLGRPGLVSTIRGFGYRLGR